MDLVGYSQECECWSAGSLILRVTFMCNATGLSRDRRMLQHWMQNCGGLAFVATAAYSIRIINAKRKESGTAVHVAHRLRPPSSVSVQKDHDQTSHFVLLPSSSTHNTMATTVVRLCISKVSKYHADQHRSSPTTVNQPSTMSSYPSNYLLPSGSTRAPAQHRLTSRAHPAWITKNL
jgi:hypothetical protein